MRKMKLSLVLPVSQALIAAALLKIGDSVQPPHGAEFYVPTLRLICMGVNAPALLFRFLDPISHGPEFGWFPRSVLGIDTNDFFFLIGVFVLWYFVGRAFDKRSVPLDPRRHSRASRLIVFSLILALGILLSGVGLWDVAHPLPNGPVRAILTLVWAVGLICTSIGGIVLTFRPVTPTSDRS